MSHKLLFTMLFVAAVVLCINHGRASVYGKPEYIQAAESRVGSYLTSDYGVITCESVQINDKNWDMKCLNALKTRNFEFAVYPAEMAPYNVSRTFYLEALNKEARQSASQGLMEFLQINTKTKLTSGENSS